MELDLDATQTVDIGSMLRDRMNRQQSVTKQPEKESDGATIVNIDIEILKENPYQPRRSYNMESLLELASSIKERGLLQPIGITKEGDTYYVLFGHRRLKAFEILKRKQIPAIFLDNADLRTMAIIENLQRDDMHHIETAFALKEALSNKFTDQKELARAIGKDKSYVSRMIALLTFPEKVIEDLLKNKSINDMLALDMLRKIDNKELCEEIYFWYINSQPRPNRNELKNKIENTTEDMPLQQTVTKIINTKNACKVQLPHLSDIQLQKLNNFLDTLLK